MKVSGKSLLGISHYPGQNDSSWHPFTLFLYGPCKINLPIYVYVFQVEKICDTSNVL